jgi:hypothetical protein
MGCEEIVFLALMAIYARAEYIKLEKSLTEAEIGGWP